MSRKNHRNGVILLLILALLTLFASLSVGFILLSSHQHRLARLGEKIETGDARKSVNATKDDLNQALRLFLRGADRSIIGPHSLLENLYGQSDISGKIVNAWFWDDSAKPALDILNRAEFENLTNQVICLETSKVWENDELDRMGNVLTITSNNLSNLKNKSTRILSKSSKYLVILPFKDMMTGQNAQPLVDCSFVINGAPFSGEGAGYDSAKASTPWLPQLTLEDDDTGGTPLQYALRPNVLAPNTGGDQAYLEYLKDNTVRMNVDYTAPDTNNMFLAWYDFVNPAGTFSTSIQDIIPSFHRPELVGNVMTLSGWGTGGTGNPDMLRKVVLRPLPFDHPDFTGSNPNWNPVGPSVTLAASLLAQTGKTAPYLDVDNDGDGVKDGIWIDPGLPIRRTADGKEYKVLMSVTVLDLDGRTNVNVHGNLRQFQDNSENALTLDVEPSSHTISPRGNGNGPGGVRLSYTLSKLFQPTWLQPPQLPPDPPVLSNPDYVDYLDNYLNARQEGENLASGFLSNLLGRYNSSTGLPGPAPVEFSNLSPKHQEWYRRHFDSYPETPTDLGAFMGSPSDLWDSSAFALDALGQETFMPNNGTILATSDFNPYKIDPYHPNLFDTPFTAAELEALLRTTDVDVTKLPQRLRQLLFTGTGNSLVAEAAKYHLTTMSNDIPVPNRRIGGSPGIWSRVYSIFEKENGRYSLGKTDDELQAATLNLLSYLPEEIRNGERLDLNKLTQKLSWMNPAWHLEGLKERADLARGIYLFLMIMCYEQLYGAPGVAPYKEPSLEQETRVWTNPELCRQVMATRLAQFAVNLVDFIDPDDVMTPMVFDIDPFEMRTGGWCIPFHAQSDPGIPTSPTVGQLVDALDGAAIEDILNNTNNKIKMLTFPPDQRGASLNRGRLVWGMEQPNLLLTETFATHDHKIAYYEDSSTPGNSEWKQVARPEGSLWIELYHAGNPNAPNVQPINLAAMDSGDTMPVWRIAISESTYTDVSNNIAKRLTVSGEHPITFSMQSDQPIVGSPSSWSILGPSDGSVADNVKIDRWVAFTPNNPSATNLDPLEKAKVFWSRTKVDNVGAGVTALLSPGQFLVLSPREMTYMGSKKSTSAGTYGDKTDVPAIDVSNFENFMVIDAEYQTGGIAGLNVSMPVGADFTGNYVNPNIPETVPVGFVLDSSKPKALEIGPLHKDKLLSEKSATIPMYRTAMLQRLADPKRAYDPVVNPYITVDWNMIDLTTFTGEDSGKSPTDPAKYYGGSDRWKPDSPNNDTRLASRQWGRSGLPSGLANRLRYPNPWMRVLEPGTIDESSAIEASSTHGDSNLAFPHVPSHTLGFVNKMKIMAGGEVVANALGQPQIGSVPKPYVNLAWKDAPFANPYEVMLVPASAPGRFGLEFIDNGPTGPLNHYSYYAVLNTGSLGSAEQNHWRFGWPLTAGSTSGMGHLLNFFHSHFGSSGIYYSLNLSAFLDHIQVPSRFLGTKMWLDTTGTVTGDPISVSLYREPGRINLNTVNEPTYLALMNDWNFSKNDPFNHFTGQSSYELFYKTRLQGYLRSAVGSNMVSDIPSIRLPSCVGLIQPIRTSPAPSITSLDPMFMPDSKVLYNDPSITAIRSSKEELTGLMRLSSMTTNRSNCFAVWITLGYFEVSDASNVINPSAIPPARYNLSDPDEKAKFDAIYPDGRLLGKEVGYDSGDIIRHRGFYLIDRTIPVGFQRGKDYNVLDTVILNEVIE